MSVSSEWCMLSGRGPYDGMITGPEEPYRMFCVWVWSWSLDHEGGPERRSVLGSWKEKHKYLSYVFTFENIRKRRDASFNFIQFYSSVCL